MNEIIVLSGHRRETKAFADQRELRRVRYITGAQMLKGIRSTEIHVLPGYAHRPDRHAIDAELRYRRGIKRIDYVEVEGGLLVECGTAAANEKILAATGASSPAELVAQIQGLQLKALTAAAPAEKVKPAPKPRAKKAPAAPKLVDKPGETPAGRGNLYDFLDGVTD